MNGHDCYGPVICHYPLLGDRSISAGRDGSQQRHVEVALALSGFVSAIIGNWWIDLGGRACVQSCL